MNSYNQSTQVIISCECGCGNPAPISKQTDTKRGVLAGHSQRYIRGHQPKVNTHTPTANAKRSVTLKAFNANTTRLWKNICLHSDRKPFLHQLCFSCYVNLYQICGKLCECGCGNLTSITKAFSARRRLKKGQPARFIVGHQNKGKGTLVTCGHFDKRRGSRGLCQTCYISKLRREHPEKRFDKTNPEKAFLLRRRSLFKKRYGIIVDQYNKLWEAQQGKCANVQCQATFPVDGRKHKGLHVDHDHTTRKVRGLLCHRCNLALGYTDDDIARLHGLITYLETHATSHLH